MPNARHILALILPGMLIAATGVGAGDLATASIVGSKLGATVLWAVIAGGIFKYVLTEGLARWQLVQGDSFLAALVGKFGQPFKWIFLSYLCLWSFFVGSALISACGVSLHALVPIFTAETGKAVFGIACSLAGLAILKLGNFVWFERLMGFSVGLMFCIVIYTAILMWPGTTLVLSGIFNPSIPTVAQGGLTWTLALIGGVGGTLTIFCYGYWIREKGRLSSDNIKDCKIDLVVGYSMTVLFGMAMVIIGSNITVDGKGARLLVQLGHSLEEAAGPFASKLFLIGAFCAIFSSLLGVWQAVPYLYADLVGMQQKPSGTATQDLKKTKAYQRYQVLLCFVPMAGLFFSFTEVQKYYALVGALFMPFLALALLAFNNQAVLRLHKNSHLTNVLLIATCLFFSYLAWQKL